MAQAYYLLRLTSLFLLFVRPICSLASIMPPLVKTANHLPLAEKAMAYFDASTDPFHAVQSSIELLQQAGFEELSDGAPYQGRLTVGGKYYFTRNKSTLVAFCIGRQYRAGNGFSIIGGHVSGLRNAAVVSSESQHILPRIF